MKINVPTQADYLKYTGAHCFQLWKSLSDDWQCPACQRTKFEIMRWTTRYIKNADGSKESYKGWMAGLHRHHDHSSGLLFSDPYRFNECIVCDQCNASDGVAKRMLKLPDNFSFSVYEISQFVLATPHKKHKVKRDVAEKIYENLMKFRL